MKKKFGPHIREIIIPVSYFTSEEAGFFALGIRNTQKKGEAHRSAPFARLWDLPCRLAKSAVIIGPEHWCLSKGFWCRTESYCESPGEPGKIHPEGRAVLKKKGKENKEELKGGGEVYVGTGGPSQITPSREHLRLQRLIWQRGEGSDVDLFCFSLIRIMIGENQFACSKYFCTRAAVVCWFCIHGVPCGSVGLEAVQACWSHAAPLWLQMQETLQLLASVDSESWCLRCNCLTLCSCLLHQIQFICIAPVLDDSPWISSIVIPLHLRLNLCLCVVYFAVTVSLWTVCWYHHFTEEWCPTSFGGVLLGLCQGPFVLSIDNKNWFKFID